ncbi:NfeD family protein [Nocardioides sp. dk4132]|uniref:NfeD family protein n=1 Tax=unclassified Nocardioides TaxID=2615069 RepID=UPI0012957408|nr:MULTISPECIES: NfeD family protein [unclassified Nocardioides]MQW75102.1 NfeD family protein [Nocardioides sp. dk4132]QGA07732.1 NfeD family protein [Nocardioides sp. dk884]
MEWLSDNQWAAWLALAMTLGVVEIFSLELIFAMLAFGALAGMGAALVGAPVVVSALVAAGVSAATLAVLRPTLVRRMHGGPELTLGHGKLVGQQGTVTQRLSGLEIGRVRLGGEIWSAAPYDSTLTIEPGETVEVFEIRGATAYVHPVARLE